MACAEGGAINGGVLGVNDEVEGCGLVGVLCGDLGCRKREDAGDY